MNHKIRDWAARIEEMIAKDVIRIYADIIEKNADSYEKECFLDSINYHYWLIMNRSMRENLTKSMVHQTDITDELRALDKLYDRVEKMKVYSMSETHENEMESVLTVDEKGSELNAILDDILGEETNE